MTAQVVVVTGTGTEVGKTWVTAELVRTLRARGRPCAARKPVQSFAPGEGPTDADVLAAASGEVPDLVTPRPRWYEIPVAPPMAAEALGRPPIALGDLVAETSLPDIGIVFVEGVGGPRSPLADDGDTVELAEALGAHAVVLVARPGLGTINDVLLAAAALPAPLLVFLNCFDPADELHRRNRRWLEEIEALDVSVRIPELLDRIEQTLAKSFMEVR